MRVVLGNVWRDDEIEDVEGGKDVVHSKMAKMPIKPDVDLGSPN